MKRFTGQVTVFLSLTALSLFALFGTCLEGSRCACLDYLCAQAANSSLRSVFAGFQGETMREYGLLLCPGREGGTEVWQDVMLTHAEKYLRPGTGTLHADGDRIGLLGLELESQNAVYITEDNGAVFTEAALTYMKSAGLAQLLQEVLGRLGLYSEEDGAGFLETIGNMIGDKDSSLEGIVSNLDDIREQAAALQEEARQKAEESDMEYEPPAGTSEDVSTSLLIRKNKERGTYMRKRMEDAVHQVVQDAPSQLQMLFSLSNSNELLFADYVLLTEGKTEWRVLPALFERITGQSFALIKCALVRQGGVSNTRKSMQVLDAMDMPVRAIVDLDYAFTTATRDGFLEPNDRDLFRELAFHNHLRLVNGLPVNKHSNISASTAYAMMAEMEEAQQPIRSIHAKLRNQGIWVWTRGAIEEHLGLEAKNEQTWSKFIERSKSPNFIKTLPDYASIEELCNWIIEGSHGN